MTDLEYPDSCVISRSDGETDDYGIEIMTEIYRGECMLQMSGILGNARFDGFQFEHEPILFIPINDVSLKVNDLVEVTTFTGRTIQYTIKNWEAIRDFDIEELNDICIWLKDGADTTPNK